MKEKEKMLAGKPYRAFGEELLAERQAAKELIFEFNTLHPSKIEQRNKIMALRCFVWVENNCPVEM